MYVTKENSGVMFTLLSINISINISISFPKNIEELALAMSSINNDLHPKYVVNSFSLH